MDFDVGNIRQGSGVESGTIYPENIHINPAYTSTERTNDLALLNTPEIGFSSKLKLN